MNTRVHQKGRNFKSPEIFAPAPTARHPNDAAGLGFTILELLVIISVILFLASVAGAGFNRIRHGGQAIGCLSNLNRLATAWQMYSHDNNDRFVPVPQGPLAQGGLGDPYWGAAWVSGWLDWTTSSDNTNIALLTTQKYSRLASYVNPRADIFRCPADRYVSTAQKARGWSQRARSYSANAGIGAGNAQNGPWNSLYKQITKGSEFQYPAPWETWIFVDEHPDSINDAAFFNPEQTSWIDLPATHHNGGAGFSFADGHAEMHKWTGSLARLRNVSFGFGTPSARPGDADIHWMSYHTQRISTNSF